MRLLTKTNRYYLLLAAVLFALGGVAMYASLNWALRSEVDEQLLNQQRALTAGGAAVPPDAPAGEVARRRAPQPAGLRDTLLYDAQEQTLVPYRTLSFAVRRANGSTAWLTVRKSLLETADLLLVVLSGMLGILGLLLLSLGLLNRWLTRRLWAPFRRTLAELRAYDLPGRGPLRLPPTPIDEFTELNQALTQMSARLAADYQSLREFTENAAHETQTPLAIMQAKLEQLVQDETLRPASAALVGELYGATQRLSRLHQALTLLSNIENQQFGGAVPVHLERVVENKIRQLADLAAARGLALHSAIGAAPPLTMHPGLADSLVHNLLQNAVKHNHAGGRIHVALDPAGLTVANTGPAIAGDPARFFERFRKHQAASASPGLGLSIVQQICRYYGFALRYDFEPTGAVHTLRVGFAADKAR